MHFDYFEHTADIGIRGYGASYAEALEAAARGMMAQICDASKMTVTTVMTVTIQQSSLEDCTVRFLNHLIFLFETSKFVPLEYTLTQPDEFAITAVLQGDTFNQERDEFIQEIKAATYHQFKITHNDNLWMIQVIVDI
jgi:SHS2 domain-containing protein